MPLSVRFHFAPFPTRVPGAQGYLLLDPEGDDEDDEWDGVSTAEKGKQKMTEAEYEDEEILATVAVVEDFDPDSILHGPIEPTDAKKYAPAPTKPVKKAKSALAKKPRKKKPSDIKYETKSARQEATSKQRRRRTEKAEIAGGRASRKSKGPGKASTGKPGSRRKHQ